jgi:hypothetical protein
MVSPARSPMSFLATKVGFSVCTSMAIVDVEGVVCNPVEP